MRQQSRLLLTALVCVLALDGCKSITDALNTTATSGKTTYPSIWINASWSGGRTGSPLDTKAVTPTPIYGSYCPATAVDLQNHNANYWSSGGDVGLTVLNHCTAAIEEAAICRSAGSSGGTAGSIPVCAIDPRLTPFSNLLVQRLSPSGRNTYGTTSVNLDINVFYCAAGSRLNLGQVSGKAPTDCIVQ